MKKIVEHCNDIVPALKNIKELLAVDGRVNMTNYILANAYLDKLIKLYENEED